MFFKIILKNNSTVFLVNIFKTLTFEILYFRGFFSKTGVYGKWKELFFYK